MSDTSKPAPRLEHHCRSDTVTMLIDAFDKVACDADASELEVLVAAMYFVMELTEYIPNPAIRYRLVDSLINARDSSPLPLEGSVQ
jgi:hypothetical protein